MVSDRGPRQAVLCKHVERLASEVTYMGRAPGIGFRWMKDNRPQVEKIQWIQLVKTDLGSQNWNPSTQNNRPRGDIQHDTPAVYLLSCTVGPLISLTA